MQLKIKMAEKIEFEEEMKKDVKANPYEPVFTKYYVTMHHTIFRLLLLIVFIIGVILGWWFL